MILAGQSQSKCWHCYQSIEKMVSAPAEAWTFAKQQTSIAFWSVGRAHFALVCVGIWKKNCAKFAFPTCHTHAARSVSFSTIKNPIHSFRWLNNKHAICRQKSHPLHAVSNWFIFIYYFYVWKHVVYCVGSSLTCMLLLASGLLMRVSLCCVLIFVGIFKTHSKARSRPTIRSLVVLQAAYFDHQSICRSHHHVWQKSGERDRKRSVSTNGIT